MIAGSTSFVEEEELIVVRGTHIPESDSLLQPCGESTLGKVKAYVQWKLKTKSLISMGETAMQQTTNRLVGK